MSVRTYLISLGCLLILPLAPEATLWLSGFDDIKSFAPAAYYAGIAGFLLWSPALFLRGIANRIWILVVGTSTALATLLLEYQALSVGARWDATAHAALWETNAFESWGYLKGFISPQIMLQLALIAAAFAAAVAAALRSRRPSPRIAVALVAAGSCVSTYGLYNFVRYGRRVAVASVVDGTPLRLIQIGPNAGHPLLRLAYTQWNYSESHRYQEHVRQNIRGHLAELQGATVLPGATPPQFMVVVIGESASRRHWSLYGYPRETTPRLESLGRELVVFRDAICRTVGTLTEIHGMLCTSQSSLPILPLFTGAGYRTHWFSAQLDQGPNDVKMAELVLACDERQFLNGAYDGNLVALVRRAVDQPGRHFIVVNLFGSHVRYDDRYPATFDIYHGKGTKEHRVAAYDNSIRYTDEVLYQLIALLRSRPEPSCLLYVSDHGEDVYDSTPDRYLFRSDSVATDAMYEIPLVLWFSPSYRSANPAAVAAAAAATDRPVQSIGLYHTLIDLGRLQHPVFDPRASVISSEFIAHPRYVGAAGRLYTRPADVSRGSAVAAHE